jgi:hypothetical protein
MAMLKSALGGKPYQLIENLGYTDRQYEMAITKLDKRYGGERRILQKYIEKLRTTPKPRMDDIYTIVEFTDQLCDTVVKMVDGNRERELYGDSAMYTMVMQQVPESLMMKYYESDPEEDGMANFTEWLSNYVNRRLELFQIRTPSKKSQPTQKSQNIEQQRRPTNNFGKKRLTTLNPTAVSMTTTAKEECLRCSQPHPLEKCKEWKAMTVSQRWDLAREKKACYRCLQSSHQGRNCSQNRKCGLDGCEYNHHRDLHSKPKGEISTEPKDYNYKKKSVTSTTSNRSYHNDDIEETCSTKIALRLLPVYVVGKGGRKVTVNALLDEGSDTSYIKEEVIKTLGIQGIEGQLEISTISSEVTTPSQKAEITIQSLDGKFQRQIEVWTMPEMCNSLQIVNWGKLKDEFRHLSEIPFPKNPGSKTVDLLLGSDYPELGICIEERVGEPGDPIARKTPLGWTCVGKVKMKESDRKHSNSLFNTRVLTTITRPQQRDEEMCALWNQDLVTSQEENFNPEEKMAIEKATKSLKHLGDRYEIGIPWRKDKPELPDNRAAAERRLRSLEMSLRKKSAEVFEQYQTAFNNNIEKGYIQKIDFMTLQ